MKKTFILWLGMAFLGVCCGLTSCSDDNECMESDAYYSLANARYSYTSESGIHEEFYFWGDQSVFSYNYRPEGGGGYITEGIPYKFVYPYIFFDKDYESRMDVKMFRFTSPIELEVTRRDGSIVYFRGGSGWDPEMEDSYMESLRK